MDENTQQKIDRLERENAALKELLGVHLQTSQLYLELITPVDSEEE
jgi:hypothetical protein